VLEASSAFAFLEGALVVLTRGLPRLAAGLLCWSVSATVLADGEHHSFWAVKGKQNTVYLLGSVHVLRLANSDLPPEVLQAYAGAKALVMEIDLGGASGDKMLSSINNLATLPSGETLQGALGPEVYDKFAAHARELGFDPAFMSHFQPWFAVSTLEVAELARLGFTADAGVDVQLARRAQTDHKKIIGLETVEEQIGIFARMSPDEQRDYVLYTLTDTSRTANAVDAIISAWRAGDTEMLERLVGEGLDHFPDLTRRLVSDRNHKWLPTITRLLGDDGGDYLVVVGALHLIGTDGILKELQLLGYQVVQH
jgi:uncharacterized protein YbaP (TraB family)